MPQKPPLSEAVKGMILAFHNEGVNNSEIARRLHIDEEKNKIKTYTFVKTPAMMTNRALVNTSRKNRWMIPAPALHQDSTRNATCWIFPFLPLKGDIQTVENCEHFIDSMPGRCQAVINAHGGHALLTSIKPPATMLCSVGHF